MGRSTSLLGMYKESVYPLLVGAGFTGTVAASEMTTARGAFWANASGKGGTLKVRIYGYPDAAAGGVRTLVEEELDTPAATYAAAIKTLVTKVNHAIAQIEKLDRDNPIAKPRTLADALRLLVERCAGQHGAMTVNGIKPKGRAFIVTVKGKPPITVDRLELFTLTRALWGAAAFRPGRSMTYALRSVELVAYIELLAAVDKKEARALYVHTHSAYQTHFDTTATSVLATLFPAPLWASKHLNEASSGARLILRAVPHATTGDLVDRVGALSTIFTALGGLYPNDKASSKARAEIDALIASLAKEKSPLLREASWMLAHEVGATRIA